MSGKTARRTKQRRSKKQDEQEEMELNVSDDLYDPDDHLPGPSKVQDMDVSETDGDRQRISSATVSDCLSWTTLLTSNFPANENKAGQVADDENRKGLPSKRLSERAIPIREADVPTKGHPCAYTEYIRYDIKQFKEAPTMTYGKMISIMKTLQKMTFHETPEGPCADDVTDMDRRFAPGKSLPVDKSEIENACVNTKGKDPPLLIQIGSPTG